MSGRLKFAIALGFVLIISLISIFLPLTTFAKTKVKFVVRFPWNSSKTTQIAIITPVVPAAIPTIIPTLTPTAIPSSTPTLTPTATPTPEPQKTIVSENLGEREQKSDVPDSSGGETVDQYLMRKMNEYRTQNGMPEIGSDEKTCEFAMTRAREIASDFSHAGFRSRIDSNSLPYPNYGYVNENIAQNSDFTRVIDSWIKSPGHAENMRQNLSTACIRHSGEYYVFEGWRG